MEKSGIHYLLGIDGGGTKTEFLLTDTNKNELKRIVLGASNPVNGGIENTFSILKCGIDEICSGISFSEISLFAGIAGSKSREIQEEISDFLSFYGFGKFSNGSDTENAISTALEDRNGIAVIMGTGIIAYARYGDKLYRTGGWGYMIDKGGSAYCYGADALNCALSCIDGRGGSELIKELIEEKLSLSLEDAIPLIYKNGPGFVASLAPVIFEAYKENDIAAEEIIKRNCKELADIIRAAGKNVAEEKIETVLLGGLCRQKSIISVQLENYLEDKYLVSFSEEPMVNGAIFTAQKINEGRKC